MFFRKPLHLIFFFGSIVLLAGLIFLFIQKPLFISPLSDLVKPKIDYSSYSYENLASRKYFKSEIRLERAIGEEKDFTTYLFSFAADGRRITGMANFPQKEGKLPVLVLLRGWVDEEIYQTGMGTEKMADFLAKNGFITLAPDFLGYGDSDSAFPDMLQTRFFRPITVISLLNSIFSLPQADPDKVALWGHSNGGQIALSVLEITKANIPASLWAPVSAAFPESILYFADEMEDEGKLLRKIITDFEKEYDSSKFSTTSYYQQIQAPLQIHQGLVDESIPVEWTENLVRDLRQLDKNVTYYQYPKENHNFTQGSAAVVRERDLKFFKNQLGLD